MFFCNSGAEACEGAIKLARRYHFANGHPERWRIITFKGAFHGRTLATIAAAGNEKYLEGFGQPAPGFDLVPFGDLEAVEKAIGPETAAIMIEPVQGEGGVRVGVQPVPARRCASCATSTACCSCSTRCNAAWAAPASCSPTNGRASTPDVMAVAKGIGGGFPVGAFLATEEAAKGMVPGTHGSTFGGNPLAMAVGNAVLDAVLEPGFLDQVQRDGSAPQAGAGPRQGREPRRGRGGARQRACWSASRSSRRWATSSARAWPRSCLTVGAGENVVRLLPPLNVTEAEIARGRAAAVDGAATRRQARRLSRPSATRLRAAMAPRHFLDIDRIDAGTLQAHPRHGARHEEGGQARAGQAQAAPASRMPC